MLALTGPSWLAVTPERVVSAKRFMGKLEKLYKVTSTHTLLQQEPPLPPGDADVHHAQCKLSRQLASCDCLVSRPRMYNLPQGQSVVEALRRAVDSVYTSPGLAPTQHHGQGLQHDSGLHARRPAAWRASLSMRRTAAASGATISGAVPSAHCCHLLCPRQWPTREKRRQGESRPPLSSPLPMLVSL